MTESTSTKTQEQGQNSSNRSNTPNQGSPTSPTVSESNMLAALSYLWALSVLVFILQKDDEFVLFHAKQGMVLFGLSLVLMLVWVFPIIGGLIAFFGWLVYLFAMVVGVSKSYAGEKYRMPFVADIADKIVIH